MKNFLTQTFSYCANTRICKQYAIKPQLIHEITIQKNKMDLLQEKLNTLTFLQTDSTFQKELDHFFYTAQHFLNTMQSDNILNPIADIIGNYIGIKGFTQFKADLKQSMTIKTLRAFIWQCMQIDNHILLFKYLKRIDDANHVNPQYHFERMLEIKMQITLLLYNNQAVNIEEIESTIKLMHRELFTELQLAPEHKGQIIPIFDTMVDNYVSEFNDSLNRIRFQFSTFIENEFDQLKPQEAYYPKRSKL